MKKLKAYLNKRGNSITGLEGVRLFGTMKLVTRINELKNLGFPLKREWEQNGKKRYIRYSRDWTRKDYSNI